MNVFIFRVCVCVELKTKLSEINFRQVITFNQANNFFDVFNKNAIEKLCHNIRLMGRKSDRY